MLWNSWGGDSANTKFLKLVSEAGPTETLPKFVLKEKNAETGHYDETESTYTKVSGVVEKIRTTHNGKTGQKEVKGFILTLLDWGERYNIDSTVRQASKDIVNVALVNVGQKINISLYLNPKGYPSASIKDDEGEHSDVKYAFDPKNPLDTNQLWDDIKAQEPIWDTDIEDLPF